MPNNSGVTTFRPKKTHVVTVTSTSAKTPVPFNQGIQMVRVVSTTACHITVDAFDSNPTAATTDAYLPADTVEYFPLGAGESIAFIRNAADGTAYVTEMTR